MHSSSHRKPVHTFGKSVEVQETERRIAERHTFTASAEVIELVSGARFSTRTTDLGPGGCFVDTTVPFPVDSRLRIALQKGKNTFQTMGTVVYSQVGLGMGISFDDHDDEQRVALAEWLADITGDRQIIQEIAHLPRTAAAGSQHGAHHGPEWTALVRLVRLMIGKGILTEAEGTSVLHEPLL
ncbi:MAG: PilZ domain-containing protein [Candidatus Acidiferrales bacterium]